MYLLLFIGAGARGGAVMEVPRGDSSITELCEATEGSTGSTEGETVSLAHPGLHTNSILTTQL